MEILRNLFLMFMFYSCVGWILEIIYTCIIDKEVVNRGFLLGPYCPIYGIGSLIIMFVVGDTTDLFGVFVKSMFLCAFIEYLTSYLFEKLFKARWWDYNNWKYNLNGRVCLEVSLLFGLAGVIIVKVINPFITGLMFAGTAINVITSILAVIFIADIIISIQIVIKLKPALIDGPIDVTKLIKGHIDKVFKKRLNKFNKYLSKRLIEAFPNLKK